MSMRLAPGVRRCGVALALVAGVLSQPAPASALVVRQPLAGTGIDADARGAARVVVRGRSERRRATLTVKAVRLVGDTRYDVTVDGVRIGDFTTSRRGKGRAAFATRPRKAKTTLLGVDPRGRVVAIVADGSAVLASRIADRGLDPGAVRCCLPDDTGPECEDRTPGECAAQGGVDLGPGSCLPNPCTDTIGPAGPDIRCCLPDDSGPECEDRTAAECAAQGGVNIGDGACTPNPCGPSTPTSTTLPGGGASLRVACERREGRSKISVDGAGLAAGMYRAEAVSGTNVAASGLAPTVGDEVEFDFDSDPADVMVGATAIAADFLTGDPPRATGRLLDAAGGLVAEATADCTIP